MPMTEKERRELLGELGLNPDGETLTVTPEQQEQAAIESEPEVQTPVHSGVPDLKALTNEQLLAPDAFDTYKISAKEHGRNISSPYNKALYGRIQTLKDRQRRAQQQAKREAKGEERGYVKEKARAKSAELAATTAVEAVLEVLASKGIDLDQLAEMLKESE